MTYEEGGFENGQIMRSDTVMHQYPDAQDEPQTSHLLKNYLHHALVQFLKGFALKLTNIDLSLMSVTYIVVFIKIYSPKPPKFILFAVF